jgi:hypothetical protein
LQRVDDDPEPINFGALGPGELAPLRPVEQDGVAALEGGYGRVSHPGACFA